MTVKTKRRSLRCGGRPKADFGSFFTSYIAPVASAAGSIVDSAVSKHQANTNTNNAQPKVDIEGIKNLDVPNPVPSTPSGFNGISLPTDPTKMRFGGRHKAWIGAAIGALGSIGSAVFGNSAKKKQERLQKSMQDWQDTTQEASAMSAALNNSSDYQEDYLRQFRTAARLGKTLGAKGIYITDGGDATKVDNNTYLLQGGSHEDVNETGQTGIGINVGGNEVEAEGGEVAQKKNGALRIFSAQPILANGMSPAQAILRGYNKDAVFSQQQAFKKRNGLKDDGSAKYGFGGDIKSIWNFIRSNRTPIDNIAALATAYQKLNPNSNYNKQKGKFKGGTFRGAGAGVTWTNDYKSNKGFDNFNDAYDDAVEHNAKTFIFGNKRYNTLKENNPIREINNRAVGSWRDSIVTKDRTGYGKDFGPIKGGASLIPIITETYNPKRIKHRLGGGLTSKDGRAKADFGTERTYNLGSTPRPRSKADEYDFPLLSIYHALVDRFDDENPFLQTGVAPTAGRGRISGKGKTLASRRSLARTKQSKLANSSYTWDGTTVNARSPYVGRGMTTVNTRGIRATNEVPVSQPYGNSDYFYYRGTNVPRTDAAYEGNLNFGNTSDKLRSFVSDKYAKTKEAASKLKSKLNDINTYYKKTGFEEEYNPNTGAYEQYNTYELRPWVKNTFAGLGTAGAGLAAVGIYANKQRKKQQTNNAVNISPYIARPAQHTTTATRPVSKPQTTTKPQAKPTVVPKTSKAVTAKLYGLKDNESKTINGQTYVRRGNQVFNTTTKVRYDYANGKYTGRHKSYGVGDYSRVGKNFNDAFDAARAAGANQFRYNAGKYHQYTTVKETDAKKEALNRKLGAGRVAKALGGYSFPVKGVRPKAAIGDFIPYNKRYTSIYDAPDYDNDNEINGGNALGNSEVVATAKRIKPTFLTPNSDATDLLKVPETPYRGLPRSKSHTIFSGGDYVGLGIDTAAALSTGLINYNAAGKYYLPDRAPIIAASKLPTNYNITPQVEEVKRMRDNLTRDTYNNTSSSVATLNRANSVNLNALSELSKLYATKENEENKMLAEDAKNQQAVAVQNATNELARQSEIAKIKNEALQSKANALNVGLSGLSQAWTNFWTAGRTAYEDDQARRAMVASSKDATPTKLLEMGYNLSPQMIAGLYNASTDERTKNFYLSMLTDKQRRKYGIN